MEDDRTMDPKASQTCGNYFLLDAAIEWAEDQVVYRHGGAIDFHESTELSEQPLLAGLTTEELTDFASLATIKSYRSRERILAAGIPQPALFFLRSGAVHVTLPDGIRLANADGRNGVWREMALLEPNRLGGRAGRHGRHSL